MKAPALRAAACALAASFVVSACAHRRADGENPEQDALPPATRPLEAPPRAAPVGWTPGPGMLQAESFSAAASVGGRFYVFGGTSAHGSQVYDPAYGKWSALTPPPVNRGLARATAVGRVIYVYGGCINSDNAQVTGENWAYDTATNLWSRRAPMPVPRQGMSADAIDGKIYAAGGYTSGYVLSDALTVYDPIADVWTTRAPMPRARGYGAAAAVKGKLYYAGGTDNGYGGQLTTRADVMVYDPASDRWAARAPLPAGASYSGGAALDGKFYVIGGMTPPATQSRATWIYDPASNAWTEGPPLGEARGLPAAAAGRGALFVSGGFSPTDSFESLRPSGASGRARVRADSSASRAAERPRDFAVVIGIEKYSVIPEARYAENDADAMKAALIALGFPERNVVFLKGGRATRGAILGYVDEWLPKNVTPDSRVFFYFSGHGSPDPKNGDAYLVPWDGDAMFLKSTAYPLTALYESLARLKVKHVLVALDSCFSGAGGRSVMVAGARPLVSQITQIGAPAGVTVLSAASGDEITGALDEQEHGAFTYYLLKALGNGKRTAKTVFDELKPLVQDEAHRQNREQTPLMLGDDAPF